MRYLRRPKFAAYICFWAIIFLYLDNSLAAILTSTLKTPIEFQVAKLHDTHKEESGLKDLMVTLGTSFPLEEVLSQAPGSFFNKYIYNFSFSTALRYSKKGFFGEIAFNHVTFRQAWSPDFTYSFGYYGKQFGLSYGNYGSNRLFPKKGEKFTDFATGTISAGYNFNYPSLIQRICPSTEETPLSGTLGYALTPKYTTSDGQIKHWNQAVSLSFIYKITKNLVMGALFSEYLTKQTASSTLADFSYTLSYRIPLDHGSLSITYSNYSAYYPWNKRRKDNFLAFRDGSISVS